LKLFLDLDGVLVDFDKGVQDITGQPPSALEPAKLWSSIAKAENFYRNLQWTTDGKELWDALGPFHPSILTGVPMTQSEKHARDKYAWCHRELSSKAMVHFSKAGPQQSHGKVFKEDARAPCGRTSQLHQSHYLLVVQQTSRERARLHSNR
jgi:hypothetical protein